MFVRQTCRSFLWGWRTTTCWWRSSTETRLKTPSLPSASTSPPKPVRLFITTNTVINLQFCMDCCHSIKGWQLHVYFFSSGQSAAHMFVELRGVERRFSIRTSESDPNLRTGENRFFVKPFFWAAFFNKKWFFFRKTKQKIWIFHQKTFSGEFFTKKERKSGKYFLEILEIFLNKNFFVSYFKRIYTKNQKKLFTKRLSRWIFYPHKCWIKFNINKGKTHFCR